MIENSSIVFYAEEIKRIIEDAEYIQNSNESEYKKTQAKINAYNEIIQLIGESK